VACEVFVKIVGNKRQEGRNKEQERNKKQGTRSKGLPWRRFKNQYTSLNSAGL
jgi:hypothetical protein